MNWDDQHPTYREELGRRLLSAVEGMAKKAAAAEAAGVSVEQLNKWLGLSKDATIPKVPVSALLGIAAASGVDFHWLATGIERPQLAQSQSMGLSEDDYVLVPRYDVQLSAGDGRFIDRADLLDHIPFTHRFFSNRLAKKPDGMVIFDARGDSMADTIMDRDLVMVDTSDTTLAPAIWAYTLDDSVMLKRLHLVPEGIEVISDNPTYRPALIDATSMPRFRPIGRVVWAGRTF